MRKKQKKDLKFSKTISLQEMKEHKVKTTIFFVLRLIMIGIIVLSIIRGNWENTMTSVLTLIMFMIPSFIESKMNIDLPNVLEVIIVLFIFSANILGEMASFYEKIPFWDTMLHTLNGFICAGVGFGLIDILNREERVNINLSPIFVCVFSFCFSMTVGAVWEFFEFGMDFFFGKDMQKDTVVNAINSVLLTEGNINEITRITDIKDTIVNGQSLNIGGYLDIGIIDTMKDMFVNFIGAVVYNIIGFFYLIGRNKHAGVIKGFIPTKMKK